MITRLGANLIKSTYKGTPCLIEQGAQKFTNPNVVNLDGCKNCALHGSCLGAANVDAVNNYGAPMCADLQKLDLVAPGGFSFDDILNWIKENPLYAGAGAFAIYYFFLRK